MYILYYVFIFKSQTVCTVGSRLSLEFAFTYVDERSRRFSVQMCLQHWNLWSVQGRGVAQHAGDVFTTRLHCRYHRKLSNSKFKNLRLCPFRLFYVLFFYLYFVLFDICFLLVWKDIIQRFYYRAGRRNWGESPEPLSLCVLTSVKQVLSNFSTLDKYVHRL